MFSNPLVLDKKKNGKLRLCVDFRKLNEISEREIYPIPDGQELFDKLGGNEFFTTIDLAKGYYQIELDESSQRKTAFSTSSGHYHFKRMPFGLNSAPASFQAALEYILSKQKNRICCIYIDDIIIFGRTKTEHDKNLLEVLAQLNKFGVKLSKEKLNFCKKRVKFLGHEISAKGVSTDPDKVKAVKDWPRPETMKELNSFLGFINYYRKFIRNFSFIVEPLERIAKKEKN